MVSTFIKPPAESSGKGRTISRRWRFCSSRDVSTCWITSSGISGSRSARSSVSSPSVAATSSWDSISRIKVARTLSLTWTSTSPSNSGLTRSHTSGRCSEGSDSSRLAISAGCSSLSSDCTTSRLPLSSASCRPWNGSCSFLISAESAMGAPQSTAWEFNK